MSDLTDYDREIVAAAEAYCAYIGSLYKGSALEPQFAPLWRAVKTKREVQRPLCNETVDIPPVFCGRPAVQELSDHAGTFLRCDEHRIEVREL